MERLNQTKRYGIWGGKSAHTHARKNLHLITCIRQCFGNLGFLVDFCSRVLLPTEKRRGRSKRSCCLRNCCSLIFRFQTNHFELRTNESCFPSRHTHAILYNNNLLLNLVGPVWIPNRVGRYMHPAPANLVCVYVCEKW